MGPGGHRLYGGISTPKEEKEVGMGVRAVVPHRQGVPPGRLGHGRRAGDPQRPQHPEPSGQSTEVCLPQHDPQQQGRSCPARRGPGRNTRQLLTDALEGHLRRPRREAGMVSGSPLRCRRRVPGEGPVRRSPEVDDGRGERLRAGVPQRHVWPGAAGLPGRAARFAKGRVQAPRLAAARRSAAGPVGSAPIGRSLVGDGTPGEAAHHARGLPSDNHAEDRGGQEDNAHLRRGTVVRDGNLL